MGPFPGPGDRRRGQHGLHLIKIAHGSFGALGKSQRRIGDTIRLAQRSRGWFGPHADLMSNEPEIAREPPVHAPGL